MDHKRLAWVTTANQVKRVTGRRLQAQRAALFMREPLCRECIKDGTVTGAVIRDHIVPLAEGGPDTDENTQPLCKRCSDVKTAAESLRGRGVQISAHSNPETDWEAEFSRSGVSGGGGIPAMPRGAV